MVKQQGVLSQGIKGLVLVAAAVIAFGFAVPKPAGKSGRLARDGESLKASFMPPDPPGAIRKR